MSPPTRREARLRSRLRKWRRDPAAFMDDLPWPAARALGVALLDLATRVEDAFDLRGALAAWSWRASGAGLARRAGESSSRYAVLDQRGRVPGLWPERVLIEVPAGRAVVCAFDESGDLRGACEAGAGAPGVLALAGRPAFVEVYGVESQAGPPDRLTARPLGRAAWMRRLRAEGASVGQALRVVWPPTERRAVEPGAAAYRAFIAAHEPGPGGGDKVRAWLAKRHVTAIVSVIMPVHDPRPDHLRAAIASVRGQIHDRWLLCIADDGSTSREVRQILREAAGDPRVRLVRHETARGVAVATNAALGLAEGELVVFLDHDDVLAPHALAMIAAAFLGRPEIAAAYSDEDRIDAEGRRAAPQFKPDFDRERLLAQNYINHAFAVRRNLALRLEGLRPGVEGAQDHDFVLRVAERAGEGGVVHIPHVLYHWRSYPGGESLSQSRRPEVEAARLKVVGEALSRARETASVRLDAGGRAVVARPLPEPPPEVLAIVPSRDRPGLLRACAAGLLEHTDYPGLRLRIVDNGSVEPEALALLDRLADDPRVDVLRIEGPFNFSALNNAAAEGSEAPLLAFVNDDVLVVEPGWLKTLAALAILPDVGAVGAKLFYPDGRLQHGGIVLGLGPHRVAGHELRGAPGDSPGPQGRLMVARQVSAVTAACMVVAREKFEAVGGFDAAAFPVAFNDVDLCLKLGERGWRNLWTPHARLMHLESASRGSDAAGPAARRLAEEAERMRARWGERLDADPFYNPNLALEDESFALARQPRVWAPWR